MKKITGRIAALMIAAAMAAAGVVYAQETQPAAETQPAQQEPVILGTSDENAAEFHFVNNTGKDIVRFYITDKTEQELEKDRVIALQEALIEQKYLDDIADGEIGPKTNAAIAAFRQAQGLSAEEIVDDAMLAALLKDHADGNFLKEEEAVKSEEAFTVFCQGSEKDAAGDQPAAASCLVLFMLDGDNTEYVLHDVPTDGSESSIRIEEKTAYVEYTPAGSTDKVSTLEAEKALLQAKEAPAQTAAAEEYYDDYADDYVDYADDYTGYYDDYGNDYVSDDTDYAYDDSDVQEYEAQGADGCIDVDQAITY